MSNESNTINLQYLKKKKKKTQTIQLLSSKNTTNLTLTDFFF